MYIPVTVLLRRLIESLGINSLEISCVSIGLFLLLLLGLSSESPEMDSPLNYLPFAAIGLNSPTLNLFGS